jgi:VWFA-related protein
VATSRSTIRGPFGLGRIVLVGLAALGMPPSLGAPDGDGPVESGVVERVGVSVALIDVEVTDDDGRPIRGLTPGDFEVRLDGRPWSIYSVDDLCGCPDPDRPGDARASSSEKPSAATGSTDRNNEITSSAPKGDLYEPAPNRFILYFDFSQLQLDGRARAVAEGKRWAREGMEPGDEAMVVAYATAAGLRELSDFTENREELSTVIDEAYELAELIDPFPSQFDSRRAECAECCRYTCFEESGCGWCENDRLTCVDCCPLCSDHASEEYFHGRRSLKALRRLLIDLQREPGRKHLLLFHQNGSLYPARFFPVREDSIGDHLALVDEVAAEAALARTAVHSAYSGEDANLYTPLSNQAVSFGANVATLTGGSYNRSTDDLGKLIGDAGRGCTCTYRIGLVPPEKPTQEIYKVKVIAASRMLPYEGRVRFLDDLDEWMREAEAVLSHPERAKDLDVRAALVPVHVGRGGWEVVAQVALDLDALLLLPAGSRLQGSWDVGALLTRDDGRQSWEMLGISSVTWEPRGSHRTVVHRREFNRLKPGRYRLAAFVRDRTGEVFGGAETVLELPDPAEAAVVGPVVLLADQEHLAAPLPMLRKKPVAAVRVSSVSAGPVPVGNRGAAPGALLTVVSFLCGESSTTTPPATTVRYVSGYDTPLFKFDRTDVESAGACSRLVDRVETWRLLSGDYRYHIRWGIPGSEDTLESSAGFRLSSKGATPPDRATLAD